MNEIVVPSQMKKRQKASGFHQEQAEAGQIRERRPFPALTGLDPKDSHAFRLLTPALAGLTERNHVNFRTSFTGRRDVPAHAIVSRVEGIDKVADPNRSALMRYFAEMNAIALYHEVT